MWDQVIAVAVFWSQSKSDSWPWMQSRLWPWPPKTKQKQRFYFLENFLFAMSCAPLFKRPVTSFATEDISAFVTEDISSVASEDISSLAREDLFCVAIKDISSFELREFFAEQLDISFSNTQQNLHPCKRRDVLWFNVVVYLSWLRYTCQVLEYSQS